MTKTNVKAQLRKVQLQMSHAKVLESSVERDPHLQIPIAVEGYNLEVATIILENRVWVSLDTFKPITKKIPNSMLLQGQVDKNGQPPVRVVLKTYHRDTQSYTQSSHILLEDIRCVKPVDSGGRRSKIAMEEATSAIWEELDFILQAEELPYKRDSKTERYVCRAGVAKLSKQKKELQQEAKAIVKVEKSNGVISPVNNVEPPVEEVQVKEVQVKEVQVEETSILGELPKFIKALSEIGYTILIEPKR